MRLPSATPDAGLLGRVSWQVFLVAGLLLTALALPEKSLFWFALAFVLFRIFDILKPWPIRDVDHRLGGGAGIMLDDLMAAAYAAVCLTVSRAFLSTT